MAPLIPALLISIPLLGASAASAADNASAAAAALKVLTQGAQAPHEPETQPGVRQTHTVQRSETVDMLVRRLYAGWPFKEEVMRKALAELNPKVLPNAANNLLKRGSVLVLPNVDDLRRTLAQHYPAAADLVRPPPAPQETEVHPANGHLASAPQGPDKRRWVRFP